MRKVSFILTVCLMVGAITCGTAQINTPQASPGASFTQKFGLTEIKMEYSRPGIKGRTIFGGVVPYGELWRTGANGATKFTTSDSITFGGKGLAKGTYVLLTKPGQSEWEIILNKNPDVSVFNYKPEDNILSVKVPVTGLPFSIESFTMLASNITTNSCELQILWENTMVSIPMTNDVDSKVMAQIKQKLAGPTDGDYAAMSNYYFDNGKDPKQALEYMNKALAMGGDKFFLLRNKSLIQAKLGDKAGAIETAKKSLELSKTAKNADYIRMNEASIKEWSK